MIRRPSLAVLLVTLVGAGTAACSSGSTGGTQPVAATASPMASATATAVAPVVKVSTRTVTVTVTTSASATTKAGTAAPTASAVSLKPFVGEWVGHTRDVTVSTSGRLEEHVGDGCCDPVIDLVLQLSHPRRDGTWVATSRVVSAKVHPGWKGSGRPAPKPGDTGTVTVGADHILVDSITTNGFCDPDRTAPGTCGA